MSFLSRPLSHSVRLFANMLAGHITLKVFAGFVVLLGTSLGTIGWIAGVVPLAMTVALTALELLVAFLQAYVFAVLTYLSQRCPSSRTLDRPGEQRPIPGSRQCNRSLVQASACRNTAKLRTTENLDSLPK